MDEGDWLVERFQTYRAHLHAVAYRMLGSLSEADDAVQEAWLRLSRAGSGGVDDLGRWLTTVVARVCLDMLRSRAARREEPLGVHLPDPIIGRPDAPDPEQEALATRPGWRCWWSWRSWHRPSGWRWCCTTPSRCPLRRSPPSSGVPQPPPASWPAAPAAGSGPRPPCPMPISPASAGWSRPSCGRPQR